MRLHIEAAHQTPVVRDRLIKNGWQVTNRKDGTLLASHAGVHSQFEGRSRLLDMGLLTSRQVTIRFAASMQDPVD
jgi:hypothetical protein